MRRIIAVLAALTLILLASCSHSGPSSLRFHNDTGTAVTYVLIGGNDVGTVAAHAYSPAFEFDSDTWVDSSWFYDLGLQAQAGYLVEPGEWDIRWDGSHANLEER
jgi:hypothetical protein